MNEFFLNALGGILLGLLVMGLIALLVFTMIASCYPWWDGNHDGEHDTLAGKAGRHNDHYAGLMRSVYERGYRSGAARANRLVDRRREREAEPIKSENGATDG